LIGAIAWNVITWAFGIPSSSSHALIGGYAGAAVARAGLTAITWGTKWVQTLSFIVISPLLGLLAGYTLMVIVFWLFHRTSAARVDRFFRPAQLLSSALLSYSHGGNDAQKTMGIIAVLLFSQGYLGNEFTVPLWVVISCYAAMGLGTMLGGWRIVHTMGSKITRLTPPQGFCAEVGGAITLFLATHFGIPVSTTHTITGAVVGVGASRRLSAVRWNVASSIVVAWVLTLPAAAAISALTYWLASLV
jgi:PiT family inorganic phosphate transporter